MMIVSQFRQLNFCSECPDLFVCGPFCRGKYAASPIVPFNAGWW